MPADPASPDVLITFPPALAGDVAALLRREGIDAWVGEGSVEDVPVFVAGADREESLRVVAAHMEALTGAHDDVRDLEGSSGGRGVGESHAHSDATEDGDAPLVMERLRDLRLIALLLAPVLAVTLAQVWIPAAYALGVIVFGAVILHAWRERSRDDDDAR